MAVKKIGFVGSGFFLSEMARFCILHDIGVLLIDSRKECLEKTVDLIKTSIDKQISLGIIKLKTSRDLLEKIQLSLDMRAIGGVDYVIESISGDTKMKSEIFQNMDRILRKDVIFATHASLSSVTQVSSLVRRQTNVVGLSLLPHGLETRLVEIIRGVKTSEATLQITRGLFEKINMPWVLSHDFSGAMGERLYYSLINEAISLFYEGIGSASDIDKIFTSGLGYSMGPLRLADTIGLDRVLEGLRYLHQNWGHPRFMPSPLLCKYVEAGYLGKKVGKGFFEYSDS